MTGDVDLVPKDGRFYRVAVVDAFRQWGIYPTDVRNLSVDSLVWQPPEDASLKLDMQLFRDFAASSGGNLKVDRAELYQTQRKLQFELHEWMRGEFEKNPALAAEWGLDISAAAPQSIERDNKPKSRVVQMPKFDVHSVRRCRRIGPDEKERIDVLVEVIQRRECYLDDADQAKADAGEKLEGEPDPDYIFRGGATLTIDPWAGRIRYAIRKSITCPVRFQANRGFHSDSGGALGLHGNYLGEDGSNPFPHLHATEE